MLVRLLIVWFLTSFAIAYAQEETVRIKSKSQFADDIPVPVTITQDGIVSIADVPISTAKDRTLSQLIERLKKVVARNPHQPVLVTPQPTTPHQRVMDVLNACLAAGVKELALGKPLEGTLLD
jgi:biopolymer transport protein ExbD